MSKYRRRRQAPTESSHRIYSLSEDMARLLQEASESKDGKYMPISGSPGEPDRLVDSGLAEYHEVRHTSDTPRSVHDRRPCEWSDLYLVPTDAGLAMLGDHKRRR